MSLPVTPFLIVGLPRSRTAWLAAFFSQDQSFCYHEGLAKFRTLNRLLAGLREIHGKTGGDSDSGLCVLPRAVNHAARAGRARVAVIHRDPNECLASLEKSFAGLDRLDAGATIGTCLPGFEDIVGADIPRFDAEFDQLGDVGLVREMHAHLLPGHTFNIEWFDMMRHMRVTQDHEAMLAEMEAASWR